MPEGASDKSSESRLFICLRGAIHPSEEGALPRKKQPEQISVLKWKRRKSAAYALESKESAGAGTQAGSLEQ